MNEALMGILRVRNLCDPPYVYTNPHTMSHRVSENDLFVVLGSDGLFDFFSNEEVVELVHIFIENNPFGDPSKHLVEQLVLRAAETAGRLHEIFLFHLLLPYMLWYLEVLEALDSWKHFMPLEILVHKGLSLCFAF